MVTVFSFFYIVMFYELHIYCKIILLFILCTVILILKTSSTAPYLLACPRALKIIEPALVAIILNLALALE